MKKSIIIGTALGAVCLLLGITTGHSVPFSYISGGIGLGSFLIAGLLSGVFVSGDKIRANYWTENQGDRKKRTKSMFIFALFGAPNFISALILTLYFN
ncbi:DUF5316 domain-containing protein [Bacillus firmus]|uniref:DUF5316 domain-containing protein n=1 Tax=Cytobacillus firmus TaxID=1399 RepID=UPI001581036D|nr:DUF5316 domain-containing protein [Cytobacillus firmus]NUH86404.1 DUF5316 domain-containing protein [Cytobacillus firmus]